MELQLNYINNNSVMKAGKIKVDKIGFISCEKLLKRYGVLSFNKKKEGLIKKYVNNSQQTSTTP